MPINHFEIVEREKWGRKWEKHNERLKHECEMGNENNNSNWKWLLIEQENGLSHTHNRRNNFRYAVTNFNRSIAPVDCLLFMTTTTTTNVDDAQAFSVSFTYAICAPIYLSFYYSFYLAHLIESHLSCLHSRTHVFIIISRYGDKIPRKMENFQ